MKPSLLMPLTYYTHARRDEPKVALTFDDGPNPPRTDEIMDVLEAKGARGTFFVLGKWVERWPQAFERIVRRGHCIGNHSHVHHAHFGDFDRAEAVIGNILGRPTRFLRAHYFNYFTCLYSPLAMSDAMAIVDSDVNPADYAKTDPQAIVDATAAPVACRGVDHRPARQREFDDGLRLARPLPLIAALPPIIDGLQARGYQLVGLDQMTLADPVEWQPDDRATYASPEARAAVYELGRQR